MIVAADADTVGVDSGVDHRLLGRAAVSGRHVGGADGTAAGRGAHGVSAVGPVVVVAAGGRRASRGGCGTRGTAVFHDLDVQIDVAVLQVGVEVTDVFLVLNLVKRSSRWEGVGAREGELVPWHVVVVRTEGAAGRSVVRVVVHVTVAAAVARVVGGQAVAAGRTVDADGGVKREREGAILVHQPRGFDRGGQEDHGSLRHHEEGAEVGLFSAGLNDHGRGDFSVQVAGLNVADFEHLVRLDEIGTHHHAAAVERVTGGEAESLGEAEPMGAFVEDWALANHEVLLHLPGADFVVEVVAFCEGVANRVATDGDLRGRWRCLERRVSRTGFVHDHEGGVEAGHDRIDPLVGLDHNTVRDLGREGGVERVLHHFPTEGRCLQVEVDVTPRSIVVVVDWVVREHLREGSVRIAEGLHVRVSGPQNFASLIEAIFHRFQFLGLHENIVFSNLVVLCRRHAVVDGVPHEPRHRG